MYNYYPLSYSEKINLHPVDMVSVEQLITGEEHLHEFVIDSLINWRKALGNEISTVLMLEGPESNSNQIIFNKDGLIREFSSLNTNEDIKLFSKNYGLLGIRFPESKQLNSQEPSVKATLNLNYFFNNYGFSVLEPVELWRWHITEVRNILKLYDLVKKSSPEDRVYETIEIKQSKGKYGDLAEDQEIYERYFVHWTSGLPILELPEEFEEKTILEIARFTLAEILESHLSGAINIGVGKLIDNPSTNVFQITEKRYSKYLLGAIYYDLWQKINGSTNIHLCGNKRCRRPFFRASRQLYCNEACKQEAYRIRLAEKKQKGRV